MPHYIMQCWRCGRWRAVSPVKLRSFTFRCFSCRASRAVILERGIGLQVKTFGPFSRASLATQEVLKLNGGLRN